MTLREMKRAGVLLAIAALLFFFPFLNGKAYFIGDKTYSFQPWLTYAAQEIQAGHFPLWNPYSGCGEPFIGNPQIMLFNPAAALYWLFPFVTADQLFLALSQSLLFFFTYLLARRWNDGPATRRGAVHAPAALAALALAWSGYAIGYWEFPSAVGTLPYLPLFFLLGMGKNWITLAIATMMALSAGYIQFVYYAVCLALAGTLTASLNLPRAGVRARLSPFVSLTAAIGVGTLLALVQILPSWESAGQSIRTGMQPSDTRSYLMTPIFLVKLWIPWLTNTVALGFQSPPFGAEFWPIQRNWLTTIFLGTPVFLLSIVGFIQGGIRKFVVLAGLGTVALILAMGIDPFFEGARAIVPGFRYLTHFSNAIVLALVCLVLASTETAHPRRGRNLLLSLATFALLASGLGLAFSPEIRTQVLHRFLGTVSLTPSQDRWVMQAGGIAATAALGFAGVWLFFRHKRWAVLWCFTLVELWALGKTLQPLGPANMFHRPLALARLLADSPHRFSISPETMKAKKAMGGTHLTEGYNTLREAFHPNVPLPFRVHQTWSYEVFGFQEFTAFRRRLPDLPGESAALDFLGASHVMTAQPLPPPNNILARADHALLYTRPAPLERVSVVDSAVARPDPSERLDYLFGPWNPREEVVVEAEVSPRKGTPVKEFWRDEPGRVTAQGHGAGWLVYNGIYFPGWEAYVNGRKTPLLRANHAFQSVALPDTHWTVRLIYRPHLFRIGLMITLFTIVCVVVAVVARFSKSVARLARGRPADGPTQGTETLTPRLPSIGSA
jgi:hypothetical protein